MARTASGTEILEQAQRALREAKTVEELRQAQAVVLPLLLGASIEQTASVLGVSKGWACQLRRRFIAAGRLVQRAPRAEPPHALLRRAEEAALLAPFHRASAQRPASRSRRGARRAGGEGGGQRTATSTVYNLLHRHGWRKLVPDKRHPQTDLAAQAEWKKNSAKRSATSAAAGRRAVPSG